MSEKLTSTYRMDKIRGCVHVAVAHPLIFLGYSPILTFPQRGKGLKIGLVGDCLRGFLLLDRLAGGGVNLEWAVQF